MNRMSEYCRVELRLPNDPRATSAVSGAVEHLAERAGFGTAQQKQVAAAAEAACRAAFRRLGDHDSTVGVTVEEFEDRIEVTVEHSGDIAPAVGLEEIVSAASSREGADQGVLARMDRVQYQTTGGVSRMILIKYARGA